MRRPRNNIARLPQPVRYLICKLLDSGMEYAEIRQHPEVVSACGGSIVLHNATFTAYREGQEYKQYAADVRRFADEIERRKMSAYLVANEQVDNVIAQTASFNLMSQILGKLEHGDELQAKDISAMSRALTDFQRFKKSQEVEEIRREFAAKEADYQSKIADLSAKIAGLTQGLVRSGGLSEESLKIIEEKVGLL